MESSGKWAPDTQPCLPRSLLLASCFFTYSCRLSSVVCPPWRVVFGATASSSCPAPGRRQRVLFGPLSLLNLPAPGRRQREKKATQAYTIFFASHFCLFPFYFCLFTRSIFPRCFQDVSMEAEKTNNHNILPMETASLETPGVSICFHGG